MAKRIMLSGYYGFRNAGDDAILYAIIKALKNEMPTAEITVLSNQPDETKAIYGVQAISRWQPLHIFKTLLSTDLFISGGGSLLQDVTSKNGIIYYLGLLAMARRLRVPQMIYAQGIGPVNLRRNQKWVAKAVNKANYVSVRDSDSLNTLKAYGVTEEIAVCPDPVFALKCSEADKQAGAKRCMQHGRHTSKPLVICAPRPWQEVDRVRLFAKALDDVVAQGYEVMLLAMQPHVDGDLCRAISGHMENRAGVIDSPCDTATLLGTFAQADLVIGMRLHALIMAATVGAKVLALSYDPKVTALAEQLRSPHLVELADLSAERLGEGIKQALADESVSSERLITLAELAKLPAKMATALC